MIARKYFLCKNSIIVWQFNTKLICASVLLCVLMSSNSYGLLYNYHYQGNTFTSFSNVGESNSQYNTADYLSIDIISSQLIDAPFRFVWGPMGVSYLPDPLTSVIINDGINTLNYLSDRMQPSEIGNVNIFSIDENYLPTSWSILFSGQGNVPGMSSTNYEDYAINSGVYFHNVANNIESPGVWSVSTVAEPVPEPSTVIMLVFGFILLVLYRVKLFRGKAKILEK